MAALRVIFLAFMTWLLVVFVPSHQRGAITLGNRDRCDTSPARADGCCAARQQGSSADSSAEPTAKDRANCAVCFWAAGLLTTPPFVFDHTHAERAFEHARAYHAQVRAVALRLTHHGRDPPAGLA